jgi:hypothetical protein
MIPRLIACAVLASFYGSAAFSQTAPTRAPTAQTPAPATQAPVGHRQPRATDLPPGREMLEDEPKKTPDDIRLDRALRGVCRGC